MTKQISFLLLLPFLGLCFCQTSQAQISVGVRGGFLLTSIDKSPLADGEPAPDVIGAFQVAIPVEIAIGNIFAIQPEIMYGSHGGVQRDINEGTALGFTVTETSKIRYSVSALEIPLLAKAKLGSETLKFHVLAGPSFGFGLNGKYLDDRNYVTTLADGTVIDERTTNVDFKAKFLKDGYQAGELASDEFAVTPTNINLHFGAGISVNLGGPFLFLDARYILGLNDLRPEAEGDTNDYVYKSKRIGVSVGVMRLNGMATGLWRL
ncbi:MAG: PorT family protein [Phycisphaerae bacterium]|nr:PorT family protein [Saprospiraceae bacterium]